MKCMTVDSMPLEEFVGWLLIGATREAWRSRILTMTDEQIDAIDDYRSFFNRWRMP